MNGRPTRFLATETVLKLHAIAVEDQGGDPSVRDPGLLDAALAMPRQQFGGEFLHPDIPAMAAAYAFHICRNHPFVDGNKRAAFAAMLAFLIENGWKFDAPEDDAERTMLELAGGSLDKPQFTQWVRAHARAKPSLELRDFFSQLTFKQIRDTPETLVASPRLEEFYATAAEVMNATPVVTDLLNLADRAESQGNKLVAGHCYAQVELLIALYRIAEDMGYEW